MDLGGGPFMKGGVPRDLHPLCFVFMGIGYSDYREWVSNAHALLKFRGWGYGGSDPFRRVFPPSLYVVQLVVSGMKGYRYEMGTTNGY